MTLMKGEKLNPKKMNDLCWQQYDKQDQLINVIIVILCYKEFPPHFISDKYKEIEVSSEEI